MWEYRIYRGESPGFENATPLATVGDDRTSYTDTTASPGITYYYYITGVNSKGESGPTSMASAVFTPPADGSGGDDSQGDGDTDKSGTSPAGPDMYLYAGIGIVSVVIIAVVAAILLRKRKRGGKGTNAPAGPPVSEGGTPVQQPTANHYQPRQAYGLHLGGYNPPQQQYPPNYQQQHPYNYNQQYRR